MHRYYNMDIDVRQDSRGLINLHASWMLMFIYIYWVYSIYTLPGWTQKVNAAGITDLKAEFPYV